MLNPQFGSGVLFGVPNAGNLATNPTPMQFGILQEVQVEFKADLKKLFGTNQFPVAKARGKIDVSAKGKIGSIDPDFFSHLFFGQATTTGVNRPVYNESHPPSVSVAPTNTTTVTDLGVVNGDTGVPLTKIPSGTPVAGQYKFTPYVAAGPTPAAYVFAVAETATTVLLSYQWPDTLGTTLVMRNQLMGFAPEFKALLYSNFRASLFALQLNNCTMGHLSLPTKQEDFWVSDFTFDACTDATDELGRIYSDQL